MFEVIGDKERNVKALFEIESWVAERLIPQSKFLLREFHTPPNTFSNTKALFVQLPSKFKAYTSEARITRIMDSETRRKLLDDGTKVPRL